MIKTRLLAMCVAALFTQGCIAAGLFPLVAANGLANTPEVCEPCKAEAASVDRLADAVPGWMEESRALVGPTATTDRTGHFSWEISLEGKPISKCGARAPIGWHCDPLLEAPLRAPL